MGFPTLLLATKADPSKQDTGHTVALHFTQLSYSLIYENDVFPVPSRSPQFHSAGWALPCLKCTAPVFGADKEKVRKKIQRSR